MKFLKGESFIQGVKQDVNSIIILLNNFTERFIAVEDDLKAVKKDAEDNRQDITKLQQDVAELQKANSSKSARIRNLERQNILDQLYGRRMNILIHGQPEEGDDEPKETSLRKINEVISDKLILDINEFVRQISAFNILDP